MKILNLYAGIGGNRKLWGDEHEVTAVENVDYIADVYAHFYPQDTLVRADAHQYLLDHHKEFDFIWSSPPCPTHSKMNTTFEGRGIPLRYPDMSLYQEIIILKTWAYDTKWVVENVEPYYQVIAQPRAVLDRHLFWSNFHIPFAHFDSGPPLNKAGIASLSNFFDIELPAGTRNARKLLRNAVTPEIGAHILKAAMREIKQGALL